MSLRVLFLITDSGVGGTEGVLTTLLHGLNRDQVLPVGVIVLKSKRERAVAWEKLGVQVYSLGMNRVPTFGQLWSLKKIIDQLKPDLIHAFLYHAIQSARFLKVFDSKICLVSSPRVNYRFASPWARGVDKLLKGLDNGVICESHSGRSYLVDRMGYDARTTVVVQNGVDEDRFVFTEDGRRSVRKEWNVTDEQILLGGVGRLHAQKGFDILLQSLSQLGSSLEKFKLVLVGVGPEENSLRELAKNYSIDVVFAGARSDMPAVYSALDVFVQSSRYEGLSNALLEAMAVGRPCVATAVDGTLDVARDGANIILVKPNDPMALSIGIGILLEKPELRATLSLEARSTANRFSNVAMIRGFEENFLRIAHDQHTVG